jgi:HD domain
MAAGYRHLVRRFFGSLWPGGPSAGDEGWARRQLLPGELELWARLSGPDRRHAVGVARRTVALLDGEAARPVVAAALLHDVGKLDAGLGTFRRSIATAVAIVVGHDRAGRGDGRLGRYLRHDAIGADLLRSAGSDPLTVAWAREHHLDPARWSVPAAVGAALKDADDD